MSRTVGVLANEETRSPGTERTLAILELLGQHRDGLSLSEIARDLELPVNSVFRITGVLHEHGYVHRDEEKRFALSNKLFELARPQVREKSLVESSLESLRWLRDASAETTQLLNCVNFKMTVLEQCISTQPIKVSGSVGLQVPMYSCAPGKAILAYLPECERNEFFSTIKRKQFTPNTITQRKALENELAETHRRGFAIDVAEGLEGIHCVATAILDEHKYPVAAITVMAPSFRLKRSHFAGVGNLCVQASEAISRRLLA
jgi:IclR family acetate operon transcriptional repressor